MTQLVDLASLIRSKNAGPFWLTIDIFCDTPSVFETVRTNLHLKDVAALFKVNETTLQRFDIESLNVIKISLPRPVVQGSRLDRDMHGAQWAMLMGTLTLTTP